MRVLVSNKRANYDYDIKDELDGGLVLTGSEVKSLKDGNGSLSGSYVTVKPGAAYLINCHIGPYKYALNENYDPTRSRKLLLNQKEINGLLGKEKGTSIIPLNIYEGRRGLIKVKIGIGYGRKKTDKREYIKERDVKKEIKQHLS